MLAICYSWMNIWLVFREPWRVALRLLVFLGLGLSRSCGLLLAEARVGLRLLFGTPKRRYRLLKRTSAPSSLPHPMASGDRVERWVAVAAKLRGHRHGRWLVQVD